ncbi:MAG: EamA family transporter [Hyphomicrobiales bacterium]|nr:MAG: EamA family transporter [Hyphomicrobiales bacterium]
MTFAVFGIVLFAAALHAVWNAIVKAGSDTLLTTILVAASAALVGIVTLPFLPPVAPAAWPYLAISAVLEIAYYALIAGAYRQADMSRAYPVMRGTPPLIVALVSSLALGMHLSPIGWAGVLLVSLGLLSLTLIGRTAEPQRLGLAMINALVIASYTLVDGFGVRASGAPVTYTMWIFVLTGVPLALWALLRRPDIIGYARSNWALGVAGGFGTLISYGLVLWAMTEAPIPIVAALRETSILFGTAIAAFVLRERVTTARVAAVLVIAAGAVVLKLA